MARSPETADTAGEHRGITLLKNAGGGYLDGYRRLART
jgi:hypothetical protein